MTWLNIFKRNKKVEEQLSIPLFDSSFQDNGFLPIDEVQLETPVEKLKPPLSKIKELNPVTMKYAIQNTARGSFTPPEYELSEIGQIEDVESMVAQAFSKKLGLMFKEGFSFVSSNKTILQYYKGRQAQIAQASGIPTSELLRRMAHSLIRVSNAFLIKVRSTENSGGRERTTANEKTLKPVAAYFPAAPETMQVEIEPDTGKFLRWKHVLPDGKYKVFAKEDVIHFCTNRREGFVFGVPTIVPVIDDIRALRQIEEHIELLVYQHLFPLFHYTVGTETAPAGYTEDGRREIDVVKTEMRYMPAEGGIVTPERHEIKLIGAESKALRVETYVEHFKQRVVAGLGISQIDLGDGQTANRATSAVLSRALIDSVKAIQDSLEVQWEKEVTTELLLESPFGDDVLYESNIVRLKFAEIDIDNKIKQEEHALKLFESNGITFNEFRSALGLDPINIPEDPEDQDPKKYSEWFNTYWKLIEEPSLLIRAVDEPYSAQANALARANGSSLVTADLGEAAKAKEKQVAQEAEEDRQTKIAVAKSKPKVVKKDSFLTKSYQELESDTTHRIETAFQSRNFSKDEVATHIRSWATLAQTRLNDICIPRLLDGFNKQTSGEVHKASLLIQSGRRLVRERIEGFIEKFTKDLINTIDRNLNSRFENPECSVSECIEFLHSSFAVLSYRLDSVVSMESQKAYNYGKLLGISWLGFGQITHSTEVDSTCNICNQYINKPLNIANISIDDIAPHHPNCVCDFHEIKIEGDVQDGKKLERCVSQVKSQLRTKHPGWKEEKVTSSAWAICQSSLK